MKITVRKCRKNDKAQVIKLWTSIFPTDTFHNHPDRSFDLKMRQKDGLFFVAEDNDSIIGTVLVGFDGHRG